MSLQLQLLYFRLAIAFHSIALAGAFGYVAYNESSQCVVYKALRACFAPQLPAEELTGYLMMVVSPNACHATENPPALRNASRTCIALIQVYNCCFVEKVLHAWQARYQTALVYKVDSEQLITMVAGDKDTQELTEIPSLLPGQSVSLHLQSISQGEKGAHIRLLPPRHSPSPCQDNTKILQANPTVQHFRNIFYVIFSTVSVMVGLSCYIRVHLTKLHTYKQGDKYKTCAICLEEYKEGDCLKILSCSHAFHGACIDTWFHIQEICPFCRQLVNIYGEGDRAGGAGGDMNEEE